LQSLHLPAYGYILFKIIIKVSKRKYAWDRETKSETTKEVGVGMDGWTPKTLT
jgi:hypothetical protein